MEHYPSHFQTRHTLPRFLGSLYQAVLPDDQQEVVGKESGLTAHVERFNNTLRQRLARFVKQSLSFSKAAYMHLICLHIFLIRYNLDILANSLS